MIRDTSAQDRSLSPAQAPASRRPLWLAGAGVLALVLLGWVLSGWLGSARAVSVDRLRLAEASRGLLVRDASANGRVVAAVSPTLYAPAGGTVALKILAGDTVEAGQVLAEIDSPELRNELQREQATLAQLEAEVARQRILARKASLLAQREADDPEAAEATIEEVLRIDPEHRLARSIMTKLKARPPHPGGRRGPRRN